MSELVDMLRQIVRQELGRHRAPELGIVLEVFPGDGGEGNHQADVRLRQSGLTLRRVPVAVARPGVSLLPRIGDPVVVLFLGGDLAQPVVVGSIYTAQEQPPEAGPLEAVYLPSDAEESGVRRVHLETPSGGTVTLDDEKLTVTLGGTEMVINQDGDVAISAAGSIALKADGDITLDAGGNLKGSAGQDVGFEAQVGFSGKGAATASVSADGSAELKGAAVTIAGMTSFSAS